MKLRIYIDKITVVMSGDDHTADVSAELSELPPKIRKLALLWKEGATSRDIMEAFGMTGASDSGTTWVSQQRKIYPDLFPYRNAGSKRNGASIAALSKTKDL